MTQLFDTTTYDDTDPIGPNAASAGQADAARRHLRSIPTSDDLTWRVTQWRLDEHTIEIGRKGIRAARRALQDAARASKDKKPARKAA